MWGRSYFATDVVYDVGDGRGIVVYSVGGELSLWVGPTPPGTAARRGHESLDPTRGFTARQRFRRRPPERQAWVLGFGYAEVGRFPHRLGAAAGPIRCFAVPYWFFAVVTVVLPARVLARHMREEDKRRRDAAGKCPQCLYDFPPGVRCCPECGAEVDGVESVPAVAAPARVHA
jgi:hypothetical protein